MSDLSDDLHALLAASRDEITPSEKERDQIRAAIADAMERGDLVDGDPDTVNSRPRRSSASSATSSKKAQQAPGRMRLAALSVLAITVAAGAAAAIGGPFAW